jgi:hypothetical protein
MPVDQLDLFGRSEAAPGGAVIEGDYRYLLWRTLPENPTGGTVLWVLLNPSIADAVDPDPTLTRVLGFSRGFGFGRVEVVNLFAAISTKPEEMERFEDPVGPKNDETILAAGRRADKVIVGWGAHKGTEPERRAKVVKLLLTEEVGCHLWCLGLTKHHHPAHPLYLAADTQLVAFSMGASIGGGRHREAT